MIKRLLCVCKGNEDRSPMMAAVLEWYLNNAVCCESAGILEIADKGGGASPLMINAAKWIGIDLLSHKRRWVNSLNIKDYDLIVCADDKVAAHVIELGADIKKVCNAEISHPWPSQSQEDFNRTVEKILAVMFRIVTRYFSPE